ncbi:MAG: hypothetical protein K0U45_01120, partial [Alphaproteobacteria bacterium]|nr:hypothetical protein [Alphaproteobacteria bacterium]
PDNNMLKKLDLLHDELKRHNKLGALPNRSQAFLENYQTEQYLKQKAPQNAQKLLEDLKNNKTLTVFQAFYLSIKLPKKLANMRNAPTFDTILAKQLKELSQDVRDKAAEARELIDSKALNEIDAVIEQIRRESHQLKEEGVKIPELGNATVKQTSNFMEFRFEDVTKMRGILTEKLKDSKSDFYKLLTDPNDSFWQNLTFRTHKGEDYSAYGHNGIITYQYGFKEKPEIAKVFYIDHKPTTYNRILKVHVKTKDITILEYHPKYGALLTTFRHLQKLYKEQVNQNLIQGAVLGTYRMHDNDALSPEQKLEIPTDMNEHVHIERREAEPKDFKKFLNDDGSIKLKQFTAQANSATKLVRSTIDGNDYHAIALFTPNSALNKQLLANIKTDWQNYNDHLVKAGTFKLPADADKEDIKKVIELIMNYLLDASLRDQLTLETIVKMLLRIKILLSQIGEKNQHLEKIIQSAQRTAIDLREKKVDGRFKIIIS